MIINDCNTSLMLLLLGLTPYQQHFSTITGGNLSCSNKQTLLVRYVQCSCNWPLRHNVTRVEGIISSKRNYPPNPGRKPEKLKDQPSTNGAMWAVHKITEKSAFRKFVLDPPFHNKTKQQQNSHLCISVHLHVETNWNL